jgi:hypothetical protein
MKILFVIFLIIFIGACVLMIIHTTQTVLVATMQAPPFYRHR